MIWNIRDFGAAGDGKTLDTGAIQAAIDACNAGGGGTVVVPQGTFLTGTLRLKSHVNLNLAPTATILGSTDIAQYSTDNAPCGFVNEKHIDKVLIYADNAENFSITGRGVIDGQGASFKPDRPMLIRCYRCKDVLIEGVKLRNAAAWCTHFRESRGVRVTGVDIHNRVNTNNDGIDLMNTSNVRISDCNIRCADDAICFQNLNDEYPVEDIVITNCIMSTRWAAIRSGGTGASGMRNVTVSNCVIRDTYGCGIKLQTSGNCSLENMTFTNIIMTDVSCPISLRFGNTHYNNEPGRNESHPWGAMRNLQFSNIWARVLDEKSLREGISPEAFYEGEQRQAVSICGIPGHPVEGITFSDVHVIFPGGGTQADAENVNPPEHEDRYPEYFMWGVLPAYGLYARHAKAISLNNVRFELAGEDVRPAVVCDDVTDLELTHLRADLNDAAPAIARIRGTKEVFSSECRRLGSNPDSKPVVLEFK